MSNSSEFSPFKAYMVPVVLMIMMGLVLFLPAGSLRFWEAWLWWSIITAMTLFITCNFVKNDRSLLARRMQVREKEPQPVLIRLLSFLSLLVFVIPGIDHRYDWSAVPLWLVLGANVLVLLGYIFIYLVFKENSYASATIQVHNRQQVIASGPYAVIRHPMYLGLLIMLLFTPLALGSYPALIFASLFLPTLILRIRKEEEVLLRDLPGYRDYHAKTRFRLIPLIW